MQGEITDAQIDQIVTEVREDGVYVDPDFAREHGISASVEQDLESSVTAIEQPTRVVLVEVEYDDPRFEDAGQLAAWVHDEIGGAANYVLWRYDGVEVDALGGAREDWYAAQVAETEHPDDAPAQLTRTLDLLATGEGRQVYESMEEDGKLDRDESDGDSSGLLWFGGVIGVLALGWVLVKLGSAVPRWRAARKRQQAERPFELPRAVLRSVRAAEDRQNRGRADAEVLALGEALAGDRSGTPAGAGPAWQAALDHYAAARRVLDQSHRPADVIGALVLARRGEQARLAAVADDTEEPTPWEPTPTCWFNPLHEGPVSRVLSGPWDRSPTVPACAACGEAAKEGKEPADILDFADDDRARHYYDLPLGVWSETGYGSVEPDLLGALVRSTGSGDAR